MRKFEKPYIPNVSSFFPDKSLNKNLLPQILMHLSISDWGSASKANSHCYRYRNQASAVAQSSKAVSEEEMKQILARLSAPSECRSEEESPSLAL